MINNPFKRGDRVKIWTGSTKPLPTDLVLDHTYLVEDIVSDRVVIGGKLYFASRFMLLGSDQVLV